MANPFLLHAHPTLQHYYVILLHCLLLFLHVMFVAVQASGGDDQVVTTLNKLQNTEKNRITFKSWFDVRQIMKGKESVHINVWI